MTVRDVVFMCSNIKTHTRIIVEDREGVFYHNDTFIRIPDTVYDMSVLVFSVNENDHSALILVESK